MSTFAIQCDFFSSLFDIVWKPLVSFPVTIFFLCTVPLWIQVSCDLFVSGSFFFFIRIIDELFIRKWLDKWTHNIYIFFSDVNFPFRKRTREKKNSVITSCFQVHSLQQFTYEWDWCRREIEKFNFVFQLYRFFFTSHHFELFHTLKRTFPNRLSCLMKKKKRPSTPYRVFNFPLKVRNSIEITFRFVFSPKTIDNCSDDIKTNNGEKKRIFY